MTGDNFNWDIVVRLATQGAKQAKGDITGFSTAVDEMARTGKVSEKASEQAAKATIQQGRAAASASGDVKKMETSVISLRYANYDLASSMFTLSAGITAAGVGVVAAFASQESAFTNVERTADGALGSIRQDLMDLSTQIPLSFNELSGIATLGNQLGIASSDLKEFTTTVAQFSAVSGVSAEQSALAFGKLGNLMRVAPKDYDRLASAIELVGVNSAATDSEILSTARELAATASAAGFTAAQVVGLSGALASLGVPPERARSTTLQFFESLNMATAEGGQKLQDFASIIGVTTSELEQMVRSNQGESILQRFVGNIGTDSVAVSQALERLGLAGLRTNPTIRAMANNFDLVSSAIADGERGWTENIELQRQMAFVLDDLSTKWTTFINAAMNAGAAIGSSIGPAIGKLLDGLKNLLIGLVGFASSEFGQMFFRMAGTILTLVAGYAALRGSIALATGSLQAFSVISRALGGAGILSGLRGLVGAFGLVRTEAATTSAVVGHQLPAAFGSAAASGGRFAGAMRVAGGALLALGRATVVLGVLQAGISLITDFGGSMQWLAEVATTVTTVIGRSFAGLLNFIADVAQNLSGLLPYFSGAADQLKGFASTLDSYAASGNLTKGFRDWAGSLQTADDSLGNFGDTAAAIPLDQYAADTSNWGGSMDDLGNSAGGAAKEVRTLVDYASDLQSVFSRAFEIRFSGGSTLDAITSTFNDIREATAESARNISKLKAEIQGLQSDLNIQKYFLSIAVEYGDSARAEAIQANIAKLQADLADKTSNLTDEQDKNSKTLTGNSKAAIANRAQLEGLVKQYQEHLVALASSGLGQAELARRSQQLREEFIQQAVQLGYSRAEVERYAQAFDDLTQIINRVPRNITVSANADPALQALNEFIAKAKSTIGSGLSVPITTSIDDTGAKKQSRLNYYQAVLATLTREITSGQTPLSQFASTLRRIEELKNLINSGGYSGGGYTGAGGKYQAAGIVHRGEYVVPKKDVNQRTGLPYADAMGRLQRGASGPGYAGGGYVRGGGNGVGNGQIASFGPMAYQQLHQALQQMILLDGGVIANNSAANYAHRTATGSN